MHRRLGLLPIVLLFALPAAATAASLELVRVYTGWRDADSFRRVSEFLDGKENTGGMTVLRTRQDERAGFYWLLRLKNGGAPVTGAKFELQVIPPATPEAKTFTFSADLPAGHSLYELGLTGADWADAKAQPAAWRLRILTSGGTVLLVEKSFLWELPAKK